MTTLWISLFDSSCPVGCCAFELQSLSKQKSILISTIDFIAESKSLYNLSLPLCLLLTLGYVICLCLYVSSYRYLCLLLLSVSLSFILSLKMSSCIGHFGQPSSQMAFLCPSLINHHSSIIDVAPSRSCFIRN